MSELKTTPNIGTYFPTKVPVKDDEMHYLVPVMKWHNTEHDAQLAHQFLAALARKDAALNRVIKAGRSYQSECENPHPDLALRRRFREELFTALAACREAMGETP